jgi:hypothetical protein
LNLPPGERRWQAGYRPSPLCLEAVQRIDRLFEIERDINGCSSEQRRLARQEFSEPLVGDLHAWMGEERRKLSRAFSHLTESNGISKTLGV